MIDTMMMIWFMCSHSSIIFLVALCCLWCMSDILHLWALPRNYFGYICSKYTMTAPTQWKKYEELSYYSIFVLEWPAWFSTMIVMNDQHVCIDIHCILLYTTAYLYKNHAGHPAVSRSLPWQKLPSNLCNSRFYSHNACWYAVDCTLSRKNI